MITILFPRGSPFFFLPPTSTSRSAAYRCKVFECGNGPYWSRSPRIQISTITTHARGWAPRSQVWGDGMGMVWGWFQWFGLVFSWKLMKLGNMEKHSIKQQRVVKFAFISVMPRIGSHFRIQDLQRVQEWVYVSSADESGGLWVASVWIIGDFTNFTHKNRDWFEAWNGYGWKFDKDQLQFTQNLVLCGSWGSEVLTPLFGDLEHRTQKIHCEAVWSAGEIEQSLVALIAGDTLRCPHGRNFAHSLPWFSQHFPKIFPIFMKNGGRFPSHPWLAGKLSPGAELLASFTGPELAALIEVRSIPGSHVVSMAVSTYRTYLKLLYMIIIDYTHYTHQIHVSLLVISCYIPMWTMKKHEVAWQERCFIGSAENFSRELERQAAHSVLFISLLASPVDFKHHWITSRLVCPGGQLSRHHAGRNCLLELDQALRGLTRISGENIDEWFYGVNYADLMKFLLRKANRVSKHEDQQMSDMAENGLD